MWPEESLKGYSSSCLTILVFFAARPIDSFNRLITARRNPCLILLTIALLVVSPVLGFQWIVFWTIISTIILALRFVWACGQRVFSGPLISWISQINPQQENPSLAIKWFTGYQALKTIEPLVVSNSVSK